MSGEGGPISNCAAGYAFPADATTGAGDVAPTRSGEVQLTLFCSFRWWFPVARFVAVIGATVGLWSAGTAGAWLAKRALAYRVERGE